MQIPARKGKMAVFEADSRIDWLPKAQGWFFKAELNKFSSAKGGKGKRTVFKTEQRRFWLGKEDWQLLRQFLKLIDWLPKAGRQFLKAESSIFRLAYAEVFKTE